MADDKTIPAQGDTEAGQVEETQTGQTTEEKLAVEFQDKPEEKQEEKAEEAPEEIPDDWTPALPEWAKVDDAAISEARGLMKEMGLSKENAQKLVDFQTKQGQSMQEAQVKAWEAQVKAWEDGVKADPEFKQGFDEKRATAERAFKELFSPEERKYLADTGLSSYLFRAMYRAGVKLAEPTGEVEGQTGKKQQSGDPVERLSGLFGGTK